jgi:hypothetical protein
METFYQILTIVCAVLCVLNILVALISDEINISAALGWFCALIWLINANIKYLH